MAISSTVVPAQRSERLSQTGQPWETLADTQGSRQAVRQLTLVVIPQIRVLLQSVTNSEQ